MTWKLTQTNLLFLENEKMMILRRMILKGRESTLIHLCRVYTESNWTLKATIWVHKLRMRKRLFLLIWDGRQMKIKRKTQTWASHRQQVWTQSVGKRYFDSRKVQWKFNQKMRILKSKRLLRKRERFRKCRLKFLMLLSWWMTFTLI